MKRSRVPETRSGVRWVEYDEQPGDIAAVCDDCEEFGAVALRPGADGAGLSVYVVSPCPHSDALAHSAWSLYVALTARRLDGEGWPLLVTSPNTGTWLCATARWFRRGEEGEL